MPQDDPKRRVLIIATDGFEESELFGPREILEQRGAEVKLASPTARPDPGDGSRRSGQDDPAGPDDRRGANAEDFDALILPGGVRNPDQLRTDATAIALIRAFAARASRSRRSATARGCWSRPTCCAGGRRPAGRRSAPTSATPAQRSSTKPAVVDGNIVTSRKPDDVEAFTECGDRPRLRMRPRRRRVRRRSPPNGLATICCYPRLPWSGNQAIGSRQASIPRRRRCTPRRRRSSCRGSALRMLMLRSAARSPSPAAFTACVRSSRNSAKFALGAV